MASSSPSTTSSPSLGALPLSVFASVLAPLLDVDDLVAAASASKSCRQLVLSPPVWRYRRFIQSSLHHLPSSTTLPCWFTVIQRLDLEGPRDESPAWPSLIPSLHLFPHLRSVSVSHRGEGHQPYPFPPVTSLASLRYLTQVSLWHAGQFATEGLKLLSTLPALASFVTKGLTFKAGSDETLREWQAHVEEQSGTLLPPRADPNHPDLLLQRHSPLLLFLHALAAKPSLVHLHLERCGLTPFVCDHMPVWPHLLCLSLADNKELHDYSFSRAALLFPCLTSFTSPNCSEQAIRHLLAVPRLEELCFGGLSTLPVDRRGVQRTARGFRALQTAASLRSVAYWHPDVGYDEIETTYLDISVLASVFTLTHLTRLTVPVFWLEPEGVQLLSQHLFPHLRCLELHLLDDGYFTYSDQQTDAFFLPFVKPVDLFVPGRAERQIARVGEHIRTPEVDRREEGAETVPVNNAANFPVLECLALVYRFYRSDERGRGLSAWMVRQLRRSYEYEEVRHWESEMTTLGETELLKSSRDLSFVDPVRAWWWF